MFRNLLSKIIGNPNEKELSRLWPLVEKINALEPTYQWMTNEELRAQTDQLRARLQRGETLDDILPDAFALVREAAKRTVGMRHFDVQLLGGIVLHQCKVAEMKTGEGKTLVATLPLYLHALAGRGAHLVTVNDYLARRDAVWMGPIYHLLGLSVGVLQQGNKAFLYEPGYTKSEFKDLRPVARREAYAADITYGTNNEFGFDYLRDNLAYSTAEQVQRPLHYAIIDEVDNILIDEARTPLIISGPSEESDEEYRRFARIAPQLEANVDYEVDEKTRTVFLTEAGLAKVERLAGIDNIYDPVNQRYVHYMEQALKAQVLFLEGRDYIRQRDRIVLVDEFTGRLMPDRRLSDGLHQALEAKHGLKIRPRMVTQATITIQNYFRMYPMLAGMTGTALSEAEELHKIYGLEVVVIPTHKPMIRYDAPDVVYRTAEAKMRAIIREIQEAHARGQPVLVGTTSVEKSEELSRRLRELRIEHYVLNAKEHANEARIIARAGEPGRVTVATNMAGRGVDIKLGGELPDETIQQAHRVLRQRGLDPFQATPEQFDSAIAEVDPEYALRREKVLAAGGLYVLGTERHEARRIDDQLRGRSGRQGEPGLSRFFLSLEDDLMRRFGGASISNLMSRLGVEDDVPIEHNLVSKSIESAQARVEGYNFDLRKHLLEYDDVLNEQRLLIYEQRQRILTKDNLWLDLWAMIDAELEERRRELARRPERAWELVQFFDTVMPVNYAPVEVQKGGKGKHGKAPGAVLAYEAMRYPYELSPVRSIFLPFSVSFLAHELAVLPAEQRPGALISLARSAIQSYRRYVLEQAIGETFARARERYDQDWEQMNELLEQRVATYLDMIEEHQRAFSPREMIEQVQKGLPVKLSLPERNLAGMKVDEVKKLLEEALKQAYHLSVCEQLVRRVAAHVPAELGLATAPMDSLAPDELERLLAYAQSRAYSEEARRRIQRLAEPESAGRQKGERTFLNWLRQLLELSRLELTDLEPLLVRVVTHAYDAWSERVLDEIAERAGEKANGTDVVAVGQWLLDALARVDPQTFRLNWCIPPAFLVLAQTEGMSLDERVSAFKEGLERCIAERLAVWGEAELARRSHLRISDFGESFIDALARFWGRHVLGGKDITVGDLSPEQSEVLARTLTLDDLRERQIGTWPMFEAVAKGVAESVEERLSPEHGIPDPYLLDAVEKALLQQGWFDDAGAEARVLEQHVADLGRAERDGIAKHLGEKVLMPVRSEKIAALPSGLRKRVLDLLSARGRFTDEKRVRDFLIYRRLNDIGAQEATQVCRHLVTEQWERQRTRTIEELDLSMRERVMAGLRAGGFLLDEEAYRRVSEQRLSDLSPQLQETLLRICGMQEWPADQTTNTLDEAQRRIVWQVLEDAGLFLMRDRYEAFRLSDVGKLPADLREALRMHLTAQLKSHLSGQTDKGLSGSLQTRIRRHLEQAGYFLDAAKVGQLEQRTISSLEGKVISAIERTVGKNILAEVDKRLFVNLDRDLRERILRYLDRENIYKKPAKRRAFMQRPLADLDPALYDGIAQYLGRDALSALRSEPISRLPEDLKALVKSHVQAAGDLIDTSKVKAFEENPWEALPAETRAWLTAQLERELDELFAGGGDGTELYDGMTSDVRRFLAQRGYFTKEGAEQEFASLTPQALSPALRDEVYRALGRHLLAPAWQQPIGSLAPALRVRVMAALDQAGAFTDREKERMFLRTRLQDLRPEAREAMLTHWAGAWLGEIGDQPVASLSEETRQSLRSYLERSGYFVDQALMQHMENQPLGALRREDWQALALLLGYEQLDAHRDKRIAELPAELREEVLAYLRAEGRFLDEERRQAFRANGVASLPASMRLSALLRAQEAERERLSTSTLAALPTRLRWKVEHVAIESAPPAEYRRVKNFENVFLLSLEPEVYDAFLRYWGYPHVEAVQHIRLGELPPDAREVVRDFLGDRVALEIQKRVMLSYVSRLWIDYLTDIEDLRQGIGLEAFGQRDPLVEYKRRAYQMFQELMTEIRQGVISRVFALEPLPLPLEEAP